MRCKICLMLVSVVVSVNYAFAAIDEADWRKIFDSPESREANAWWFEPREKVEARVRERLESRLKHDPSPQSAFLKDPARANQYLKDTVDLYTTFYSRIYKGTKIDTEAAQRVLANPDFSNVLKGEALLLYIDSGDVAYLRKFLASSEFAPSLFLRVRDPAVVEVARGIVAEAYKEQLGNPRGPRGQNLTIVGRALPAFAGMMYFQEGGDSSSVGRQLFHDVGLFAGLFSPMEAARTLHERGTGGALNDYLFALCQNGWGQILGEIKKNAKPELAGIIDKVVERYRAKSAESMEWVTTAKAGENLQKVHLPPPAKTEPSKKKEGN